MLPKSVSDKLQHSFCKSLPSGEIWKSKSMRIIPEEIVRSTRGAFEHRVVFSVRWGNSWQLWLERDKKGLFMIEEDWDEFVDDNLLSPDHTLFFTHEDTMFFQVKIFDKDKKEIITVPLKDDVKPEQPHLKQQSPHQETNFAFTSCSANGGTNGQARPDNANLKDPVRYLLNPESPYFVKTITKKNDVLYISRVAIQRYSLKFGPAGSTINYILPDGKEEAKLRLYGGTPCLNGWLSLCKRNNLEFGDSVVCELESTGGLVTDVRLHFMR